MPRWLPPFHTKKKRKKSSSGSRTRVVSGKKKSSTKRPATSRTKKAAPSFKAKAMRAIKKLIFATMAVLIAVFMWILLSLPSVDRFNDQHANPGIVIFDAAGEIINSYGSVYGRYLRYDDIPKHLIDAIIATEDRNFFYHFGFDPLGLARAMVANIRAGHVVQGGSTITQQIAKNLFLSSERSYSRKFKELLMAMKLEWSFSKEKLIEIYVNRVYLGAGTFGVDAASRRYFDKSATEMNMAEAAIITGLLKAPSRFAPTSSPARAKGRAMQILLNMQDAGYIKEAARKKAERDLASFIAKQDTPSSDSYYFTDWILEEIATHIGEVTEDITVQTTMDRDMQAQAAAAIAASINEEAIKKSASQASLLAMEPDGAVKALMGGTSYSKSQFNRVVQSHRQPGSSFKLFVYLSALEQGAYPDMQVVDEPVNVGRWSPRNYGGTHKGVMTLRQAVAMSINTVAVQMSEIYGRGNVIAMARSLGMVSPLEPTPSLALGAYEVTLMEMVGAFAHLASEGLAVKPYGVVKIMNKKGTVLYDRKAQRVSRARVLSEHVVAQANDVFSAVINGGTATRARIGRPAAGKTGTTSDYKDAWFIGYTPNLVAGVWVGNDDATSMTKVTGGNLPATIWHDFMQAALKGKPVRNLPIAAKVDASGALPWGNPEAAGESAAGVGGRHLPWNRQNAPNPPAQNQQERNATKEFFERLGL